MSSPEQFLPLTKQEFISQLIVAKEWYNDGPFSLLVSAANLATKLKFYQIDISPTELQQIIESAFDSNALSRSGDTPFIDCLLTIDPATTLWTEGEESFQRLKANNTGILQRSGLRQEFVANNKTDELERIIQELIAQAAEPIIVVVIDDKLKNIQAAQALRDQFDTQLADIQCFQLNLNKSGADPTACLAFIENLKKSGKTIRIISDMDGVLIDTSRVMSQVVAEEIATLTQAATSPTSTPPTPTP